MTRRSVRQGGVTAAHRLAGVPPWTEASPVCNVLLLELRPEWTGSGDPCGYHGPPASPRLFDSPLDDPPVSFRTFWDKGKARESNRLSRRAQAPDETVDVHEHQKDVAVTTGGRTRPDVPGPPGGARA